MPRYTLPSGQSFFSETELSDEELDDMIEELEPSNNDILPASTQPQNPPAEKGFLSSAWDAVNEPLSNLPSQIGSSVADWIDSPELDQSMLGSQLKGFAAGATQGVGDVLSSFTSPLNLVTTLATGGASLAAKQGLTGTARGLGMLGKTLSAPVAAHGATTVLDPESTLAERGFGLAELAGGIAGVRQRLPEVARRVVDAPNVPPAMPDIINLPEITTAPYRPTPDEVLRGEIVNTSDVMGKMPTALDLPEPIPAFEGELPYEMRGMEGEDVLGELLGPETDPFRLDAARMRMERENAPRNIQEEDARANWDRTQRNMAQYEGRNINDIHTPLTPVQQQIKDSYDAIRQHSDEYGAWFSEQEELLPEGEYFKPPPEIEAKYKAEQDAMYAEHDKLVKRLTGGLEEAPLPDIEITPEPTWEQKKARYYELVDKGTDGTLTSAELAEAKILNKEMRENNFEPPVRETRRQMMGGGPASTSMDKPPRISMKGASPEEVATAKQQGYVPAGMDAEGFPVMELTGVPIRRGGGNQPPPPNVRQAGLQPEPGPIQPTPEVEEPVSRLRELYNLPRGAMSIDPPFMTSAAFRQAAPLAWSKEWFKSWVEQAKAFGSEGAYQRHLAKIESDPMFKPTLEPELRGGQWIQKRKPSIAEKAGLFMSDVKSLSSREESIASNWIEQIPGYGRNARASNRAYTTFLNETRYGTFKSMMKDAEKEGLDPYRNTVVAEEIASFINDATGRGALKQKIPFTGGKELSLEKSASTLREVFFSPRLMAARMRLLNPTNYISANPVVRKKYLESAMRMAGTWMGMAMLAKGAGAEVVTDPTSADFGKIKIGNTRLDPAAGFQQYLVLASRLAQGGSTSSVSERHREFGQGYKPETRLSTGIRFLENKLHPTAKMIWDIFKASETEPVHLGDRTLQMFVPMMTSDLFELAKENPDLAIPISMFVGVGGGSQTYEGATTDPTLTPFLGLDQFDISWQGGRLIPD